MVKEGLGRDLMEHDERDDRRRRGDSVSSITSSGLVVNTTLRFELDRTISWEALTFFFGGGGVRNTSLTENPRRLLAAAKIRNGKSLSSSCLSSIP